MLRTTSLLFDVHPSEIVRVRDLDTQREIRSDSLSQDVKEKVDHHYNQPSVSTTLPDKRSVKHGQERKVLDRPLKEVYKEFKQDHPEVKVGFSTFAANKPSNIHTSRKQQWYSCLCEACTNVDLKLRALNNFATKVRKPEQKVHDRYEALNITLCSKEENQKFHRLECINRQCENCSTDLFLAHLQPLLEEHGGESIEYAKWEHVRRLNKHGKNVSRVMMAKHRESLNHMVIETMGELSSLAKHLFNAKWQQNQFSTLIKDIPKDSVVLNLDFAENYSCVSQHEIQTAHWYQ